LKAITVRLEDSLHKKIKLQMVNDETTFQEYIVLLINEDIKKRENEGK
jgi:hypothetical protein